MEILLADEQLTLNNAPGLASRNSFVVADMYETSLLPRFIYEASLALHLGENL